MGTFFEELSDALLSPLAALACAGGIALFFLIGMLGLTKDSAFLFLLSVLFAASLVFFYHLGKRMWWEGDIKEGEEYEITRTYSGTANCILGGIIAGVALLSTWGTWKSHERTERPKKTA